MTFHCRNCGYSREIPESYGGRKAKCPKCKSVVQIGLNNRINKEIARKVEEYIEKKVATARIKIQQEWRRAREERKKAEEIRRYLEEQLDKLAKKEGEGALRKKEGLAGQKDTGSVDIERKCAKLEEACKLTIKELGETKEALRNAREKTDDSQWKSKNVDKKAREKVEYDHVAIVKLVSGMKEEERGRTLQASQETPQEKSQCGKDLTNGTGTENVLRPAAASVSGHNYWHTILGNGQTRREFLMSTQAMKGCLNRLFFVSIMLLLSVFSVAVILPENDLLLMLSVAGFLAAFASLYTTLFVANYKLAKALRKNAFVWGGISLLLVPAFIVYGWLINEAHCNRA